MHLCLCNAYYYYTFSETPPAPPQLGSSVYVYVPAAGTRFVVGCPRPGNQPRLLGIWVILRVCLVAGCGGQQPTHGSVRRRNLGKCAVVSSGTTGVSSAFHLRQAAIALLRAWMACSITLPVLLSTTSQSRARGSPLSTRVASSTSHGTTLYLKGSFRR